MTARALWYVGPEQAELRPTALGEGDLELRARFGAISRGTERLVWQGRVPESLHASMRGPHQDGEFPFPVKYGYAVVAEDPSGRLGFVLHPHQDRFRVDPAHFHPLPEGVPPERAVLTPNLETAINAVWDAAPGPGDRITVVGAGVVGSLVAWLCRRLAPPPPPDRAGPDASQFAPLPERAAVARALGVDFALPSQAQSDQDLVVHATGSPPGLATALGCAAVEATILELSWYGEGRVSAPLGEAFHVRRLTLRSSQVGRLPPSRAPRWTFARRLGVALELLREPCLDVLLDSEGSFEDLPEALPGVFGRPTLCHRVHYGA